MIGFALLVAAIVATGYGLAALAFRRHDPDAPEVEILTAGIVIGSGLWLAVNWLLAFFGALNARNLMIAAIVFGVAATISIRALHRPSGPSKWGLAAFMAVGLWCLFAIWRGSILPPLSHDALSYHLPKAVMIMRAEQVGPFDSADPRLSGFPSNYELFAADVLILTGEDRLTEWIGIAFFAGVLLFAATLARRWWGSGIHVTAAVLVCAAAPSLLLHSVADKNDLMAGFFATGALLWSAKWVARDNLLAASLAITCAAIAAGTKLTAGCVAIGAAPFVLAILLRRRVALRNVLWIALVAAFAFLLCGPWGYIVSSTAQSSQTLHDPGLTRMADVTRSGYGIWQNLIDVPTAMLRVSLGGTASVPWSGRGWSWARHELYASNFGALFALAVIAVPITVWRYRRDGDVSLRTERMVAGWGALIAFASLLPIDYAPTPSGIFRYSFFLLPIVIGWTLAPAIRELSRSSYRRYAHVALALLFVNFAANAADMAVNDTFAPIEYVRWAAGHPGTRKIAWIRDRAALVVDEMAAQTDVIAIYGSSDTWIHPAYGHSLTRQVILLSGDPRNLSVPDAADWVAIDGVGLRQRGVRGPTGYFYSVMAADPNFRLVYSNAFWNQAVFRRVSG